jgi:predicted nucleic acid-binding protein
LQTLGEVYAVLTGMPLRPRISGKDGIAILNQIRHRLTVVSLTEGEYFSALETVSASIVGGAAYDALIAGCAVKAGAEVLLTWNLRDFTRFGEVAQIVKTPIEVQPGE